MIEILDLFKLNNDYHLTFIHGILIIGRPHIVSINNV